MPLARNVAAELNRVGLSIWTMTMMSMGLPFPRSYTGRILGITDRAGVGRERMTKARACPWCPMPPLGLLTSRLKIGAAT